MPFSWFQDLHSTPTNHSPFATSKPTFDPQFRPVPVKHFTSSPIPGYHVPCSPRNRPSERIGPLFPIRSIPIAVTLSAAKDLLFASLLSAHSASPHNNSPDVFSFNFKLSTVHSPSQSPFPATLTDSPQLTENSATLTPVPATLTGRVKHKSFICHSYKKTPGVGFALVNSLVAQTTVCALLRPSSSEGHVGGPRRRITLSLSLIYRNTQGVPARMNDPIRRQAPGQA